MYIYLACPYSDPDHNIMERRFDAISRIAGYLMNQGLVVYSPISQNHPIAVRTGLPRGWDFWCRFDTIMINSCCELRVAKLPGWELSKGIAAEIQIAQDGKVPVTYIEPAHCDLMIAASK